jgi:hypothetical protein
MNSSEKSFNWKVLDLVEMNSFNSSHFFIQVCLKILNFKLKELQI